MLPELIGRFSCRQFTPGVALSREQIELLIKAAMRAPSGCNRQPWRLVVVEDRERIQELSVLSYEQDFMKDASCVIVALGDLSARGSENTRDRLLELVDCGAFTQAEVDRVLTPKVLSGAPTSTKGDPNVVRDCAIALYGLMLQATRMELATCWITIRDEESVRKLCGIPNQFVVVCMLAVGKPAAIPPSPRPRREVCELAYAESFGKKW